MGAIRWLSEYHRIPVDELAPHVYALPQSEAVRHAFRVVVAHRDPGMPNWISTAGHEQGLVFCRWLQSESMPEQPASRSRI